jgi:two-component system nitrate/nitrite sensor histidine kinase NarX
VDISVNLDLPDSAELAPERCAHVLAVVQEALANAVRHSHARHIKVTGNQIGDDLQLAIQDDGVGIPEQVAEGNGLRNMRDRTSLLHGRLMVERIEKGTKVTLNVPCKVE